MVYFLLMETLVLNRLLDNKKLIPYIIAYIARLRKYRCSLGAYGFMKWHLIFTCRLTIVSRSKICTIYLLSTVKAVYTNWCFAACAIIGIKKSLWGR